jgi:hypothetical protein
MKTLLMIPLVLGTLFFSSCADKMSATDTAMKSGSSKMEKMDKGMKMEKEMACPKCDKKGCTKCKM